MAHGIAPRQQEIGVGSCRAGGAGPEQLQRTAARRHAQRHLHHYRQGNFGFADAFGDYDTDGELKLFSPPPQRQNGPARIKSDRPVPFSATNRLVSGFSFPDEILKNRKLRTAFTRAVFRPPWYSGAAAAHTVPTVRPRQSSAVISDKGPEK